MPILNELLPKNAVRPIAEFRFRYEYFGNKIDGDFYLNVLNDSTPSETEVKLKMPLSDLGLTSGEANAIRDLLRQKLIDLSQDNGLTLYQELEE